MFNTVILYHYIINNDYTRYNNMKRLVFRYKNINLFAVEVSQYGSKMLALKQNS